MNGRLIAAVCADYQLRSGGAIAGQATYTETLNEPMTNTDPNNPTLPSVNPNKHADQRRFPFRLTNGQGNVSSMNRDWREGADAFGSANRDLERTGGLLLNFVPHGFGVGKHAWTYGGIEPCNISSISDSGVTDLKLQNGSIVQLDFDASDSTVTDFLMPVVKMPDSTSGIFGIVMSITSPYTANIGFGCGIMPVRLDPASSLTKGDPVGVKENSFYATSGSGLGSYLGTYNGIDWLLRSAGQGGGGSAVINWAKVITAPNYAVSASSYYTLEDTVTLDQFNVTRPLAGQPSDLDLRNYIPWFPVNAYVPYVQSNHEGTNYYYIWAAMTYCGPNGSCSLRWNQSENRAMAVWR